MGVCAFEGYAISSCFEPVFGAAHKVDDLARFLAVEVRVGKGPVLPLPHLGAIASFGFAQRISATFLACSYADAISSHREVCLGQLPPADLKYFRFHRLICKQADLPL